MVQKSDKTLCEVRGTPTRTFDSESQKVRLLTRINAQRQAVELTLVLPTSVRTRIQSQVFYLALPAKH